MKFIVPFLTLLWVFACRETGVSEQNQYEDELSISLVLLTDQIKQTAFVSKVQPFETDLGRMLFADSVTLVVDNLPFNWIPADSMQYNRYCWQNVLDVRKCYNYFTDSLVIKAGETYKLQALFKGKTISGKTDVPGDFSISVNGRTISWTESKNAYLYRINGFHLKGGNFLLEQATKNTKITINDDDFVPGPYRITVEALDKNFYDLAFERTYAAGLSGAYGVFGSVTVKTIETKIE